jgi:hypothetical protein
MEEELYSRLRQVPRVRLTKVWTPADFNVAEKLLSGVIPKPRAVTGGATDPAWSAL